MAQIDRDLYRNVADAYASIDTNLATVATDSRTALDAIVDVDTTTYPDATPSVADADAALEIELALLGPFNSAYIQSLSIATNISNLLDAVRAINNHVIANGSGADNQTKLDNWINGDMAAHWGDGGACPQGWADISEDAGYDITNWVTV